jgi:hypothetical protein
MTRKTKTTLRRKPQSPLDWLAGPNKPNALSYVEIDPRRWQALLTAMGGAK